MEDELVFKREMQKTSSIDEELEQILSNQKAKIKVIGAGGAGNNTINRISEVGIVGTATIAIRYATSILSRVVTE